VVLVVVVMRLPFGLLNLLYCRIHTLV